MLEIGSLYIVSDEHRGTYGHLIQITEPHPLEPRMYLANGLVGKYKDLIDAGMVVFRINGLTLVFSSQTIKEFLS